MVKSKRQWPTLFFFSAILAVFSNPASAEEGEWSFTLAPYA